MNKKQNCGDQWGVSSGSLCPFCGGASLKSYLANPFDLNGLSDEKVSIFECTLCDSAWQWPLSRTKDESIAVFDNAYSIKKVGGYFDPEKRKAIAETQRRFIINETLVIGRLLDVGCGDGFFTSAMAEIGWIVTGIDPALPPALLESGYSIDYIRGSFDGLPANERFDVITLWDVIEHVENPLSLIVEAASWLAPGGMLIVETGNYQSAGRIMAGTEWWNYQADHRWYLAPPQLEQLMIEAGLGDIHLAKQVLRPWWKGNHSMPKTHAIAHLKSAIKNPSKCFREWQRYRKLSHGFSDWKDWGGLEIITMTGRRNNIAPD